MELSRRLKELRMETGLNRKLFADYLDIPIRTIEDWEAGRRKPPEYVARLISYRIRMEKICLQSSLLVEQDTQKADRNVSVICDTDGNKIVVIHDIIFKGKRNIEWDDVKKYIKQYVGEFYEIAQTKDLIYIGRDLADEYAGSEYSKKLRGMNAKAKANVAQGIPEMIEIAKNKRFIENKKEKHKYDAAYGWYRFTSRFAIPVYDESGEIQRYNVFRADMIIRHDQNGKLYLYDIINIKKGNEHPA